MWMQNTYLPLDMLFIRADGSIARIAADTEPLSTRTIPSGEPVLAVLELNAGTAARLGIKPGDRVEHAACSSTDARPRLPSCRQPHGSEQPLRWLTAGRSAVW